MTEFQIEHNEIPGLEFTYELIEIPGLENNSDDIYKFRALKKNTIYENKVVRKSSPAIDFLNSLGDKEYNKFMVSLNKIAREGLFCSSKHLSVDAKGRNVYEIRTPTGNGRLFCFPDINDEFLICINCHSKSQGKRVQSRNFDKCYEMKKLFYKNMYDKNL